jgi:hypothetical protein
MLPAFIPPRGRKVLGRVAVDGHEIGEESWLDSSDLQVQNPAGHERGGLERSSPAFHN